MCLRRNGAGSWRKLHLVELCRNPHNFRITGHLSRKHTFCQNLVSTKQICFSLYFRKNVTCLNVSLLGICQVFSVSCKTACRWVTTSGCFLSDVLLYVICIQNYCSAQSAVSTSSAQLPTYGIYVRSENVDDLTTNISARPKILLHHKTCL